jgi:YD repeat-containing protein
MRLGTRVKFGAGFLLLLASASVSASTVSYRYDALHRLTQVTYANGMTIAYAYDPAGNRTQKITAGLVDTDGDGTPDALDLDDDGDGMLDEFELANQFDPLDKTDAALDTDEDGLTNLAEQNAGTAPRDSDSDNDGYLDGYLDREDVDPLDRMNPIPMEALPSRGGWRAILQ